jgi:uncharacterized membrane protein
MFLPKSDPEAAHRRVTIIVWNLLGNALGLAIAWHLEDHPAKRISFAVAVMMVQIILVLRLCGRDS